MEYGDAGDSVSGEEEHLQDYVHCFLLFPVYVMMDYTRRRSNDLDGEEQ